MNAPDLDYPVFQRLAASRASLQHSRALGDGLGLAVWRNRHDAVRYAPPGHHTLSLYLDGGYGTFRRDRPGERGAPGRLCMLTRGEDSDWVINGDLCFMHLYVGPEQLDQRAITLLDRDPRTLALPDEGFFDHAQLAALCRDLLAGRNPVADNSLAHRILDSLVLGQLRTRDAPRLRGGLAPHVRRRIRDWIEARLDTPLTLSAMAAEAALSEYHFARMFRLSFGMPPHAWVSLRRHERARTALADPSRPLGRIALDCGYDSASHFSRQFKERTGMPPSRYRALVLTP